MANGFASMIPGVKRATAARDKTFGTGGSDKSSDKTPSIPISIGAAPGQSGASGWAQPHGVNGTLNPRGIGRWGS